MDGKGTCLVQIQLPPHAKLLVTLTDIKCCNGTAAVKLSKVLPTSPLRHKIPAEFVGNSTISSIMIGEGPRVHPATVKECAHAIYKGPGQTRRIELVLVKMTEGKLGVAPCNSNRGEEIMAANPSGSPPSKRARAASTLFSARIVDMPDSVLAEVASYLYPAVPSITMFAVGMTAGEPSAAAAAILSSLPDATRGVLDFGAIEKDLAKRLNDDDVGSIISCTEAVLGRLVTLKLNGCVNISGRGLEPLRGTPALEDVDLSLVGLRESPKLYPEPKLDEEVVAPILQSIIEGRGRNCALKFVVLPEAWRRRRKLNLRRGVYEYTASLQHFMDEFSRLLNLRETACSICRRVLEVSPHCVEVLERVNDAHNRLHSCHLCRRYFCCQCEIRREGDDWGLHLKFCRKCERDFCVGCTQIHPCLACGDAYCGECKMMERCHECRELFCPACRPEKKCECWTVEYCKVDAPFYYECEGGECNKAEGEERCRVPKANCSECRSGTDKDVEHCGDCGRNFCLYCRDMAYDEGCGREEGPCQGECKDLLVSKGWITGDEYSSYY